RTGAPEEPVGFGGPEPPSEDGHRHARAQERPPVIGRRPEIPQARVLADHLPARARAYKKADARGAMIGARGAGLVGAATELRPDVDDHPVGDPGHALAVSADRGCSLRKENGSGGRDRPTLRFPYRLRLERLAVLRLTVLRLAVARFAVVRRFAVLRFAVLRLAVLRRFAVLRLAVVRFFAVPRFAVDRLFAVLRFAVLRF